MKHSYENGLHVPLKGESCSAAILTTTQVLNIRNDYSVGKHAQKQLGYMYGVGRGTIGCIIRRDTWKHI